MHNVCNIDKSGKWFDGRSQLGALSVAQGKFVAHSNAGAPGGTVADSGFDVDTDQLKNIAAKFHRESAALAKAAEKLKHSLDGLGEPWGNDEQGNKFAGVYNPHRTEIERATQALVKGLESIRKSMKDMADNHEDADHSSASGLNSLGGGAH
ncbi:WXG100 family type VII secretion target [Streptomyces lydicus]|uniref:WXG100 family type VII secretion target n=1 Tax=Streptomyces lydicus TaxID=47763 RepID=UPI00368F4AB4